MKKKIIIAILIVLTIVFGFLRDYIFVSLNRFIEAGMDADGKLALLKWVLTALFSLLYLGITGAFLWFLFKERKYILIAVFSYLFLFLVAGISAVFGYFFTTFESVYPFIRAVLGVAQSPVVGMVLIPVCFLDKKLVRNA